MRSAAESTQLCLLSLSLLASQSHTFVVYCNQAHLRRGEKVPKVNTVTINKRYIFYNASEKKSYIMPSPEREPKDPQCTIAMPGSYLLFS